MLAEHIRKNGFLFVEKVPIGQHNSSLSKTVIFQMSCVALMTLYLIEIYEKDHSY